MINVNHNVTLLKASREEWRRIESEERKFTLCEYRPPHETLAFILIDATTGEHLHPLGDNVREQLLDMEHARRAYRHDRAGAKGTVPRRSERPVRI